MWDVFLQKHVVPCVLSRLNKAVPFLRIWSKGRSKKISLHQFGKSKGHIRDSQTLVSYSSDNKDTHIFSGSSVVKDLSHFLKHSQNKYLVFLPIRCSLELSCFSHFFPWLLLREYARNLAKGSLPPQVTDHVLYFSCFYYSFQDTDKRIFYLNLLRTLGLLDLNPLSS